MQPALSAMPFSGCLSSCRGVSVPMETRCSFFPYLVGYYAELPPKPQRKGNHKTEKVIKTSFIIYTFCQFLPVNVFPDWGPPAAVFGCVIAKGSMLEQGQPCEGCPGCAAGEVMHCSPGEPV